jgi:hypothetical protein
MEEKKKTSTNCDGSSNAPASQVHVVEQQNISEQSGEVEAIRVK